MKNLLIPAALILLSLSTIAFKPFRNGKVIMIISIEVKNFTEWKKAFDAGSPVREKNGIKVISVCSATENENHVIVIEEAENAQAAHDFLTLLKAKQQSGDISKMDVKLYDKAE
ncbi:MAG TPA: hypothetical protein VGC65_11075 [Bacteroidia bacterium]|jgi:hypothetical protein